MPCFEEIQVFRVERFGVKNCWYISRSEFLLPEEEDGHRTVLCLSVLAE